MAEFVKGYLINPFLFLFLISFGLIIFRRAQRWSLILVVSLFYMVSAPITYTIAMKAWNISDTKDFSSPYDIAVVLTGMVDFHWYRSGKIKFPTVEYVALNGNRDRIFAGIHFLNFFWTNNFSSGSTVVLNPRSFPFLYGECPDNIHYSHEGLEYFRHERFLLSVRYSCGPNWNG